MMQDTIQPTRAGLMAVRRKLAVAEKGHRLLKLKRDVLILDLIRIAKEARKVNALLEQHYRGALDTLAVAEMMEGSLGIEIVAISVEESPVITPGIRNIMGMRIPVFDAKGVKKELATRGYGLSGTSSVIDEAAEAFEDLTALVIRHAEQVAALQILTTEIIRLKRRVNALEFKIIPELMIARDTIIMQRDEMEREELSRIFWIKNKKDGRY
jgi:V/A-type H+-transporting ATPase subunit D